MIGNTTDTTPFTSKLFVDGAISLTNSVRTNGTGTGYFFADAASGMYSTDGSSVKFRSYNPNANLFEFIPIYPNYTFTGTTQNVIHQGYTINPISGGSAIRMINLEPTVIQTGSTPAIIHGIRVAPTLTLANDFRSIESTNGKVIFTDTYSSGSGSLAGSLLDLNQTWNTSGTTTALKLNVTDTLSNAASLLMNLQTGGVSQFSVGKGGTVTVRTSTVTPNITQGASGNATTITLGGGAGTINYSTQTPVTSSAGHTFSSAGIFISAGHCRTIGVTSSFSNSSGTATYSSLFLNETINQTGTANGITRGLWVSPILTSAIDYRAIETSNGKVIFTDTVAASGGTNAGSLLDLRQTWNTTGTPTTFKVNVTDTASNANSLLQDLQVGGVSRFNITKAGNVNISNNLTVSGNTSLRAFTGTSGVVSGSSQSILTVVGSGNSTTPPIFSVVGSNGELFSVSDSLTGSLFSVNDISGLPIVEVFSNSTMLMGNYLAPSLNTTTRTNLTAGTNTIYSIPISAYTGAFIDYTVINTGNTSARAGNMMTIWTTGSTEFTDVSTNDIGSTSDITFSSVLSGTNALIRASATTTGWVLKTIIRSI